MAKASSVYLSGPQSTLGNIKWFSDCFDCSWQEPVIGRKCCTGQITQQYKSRSRKGVNAKTRRRSGPRCYVNPAFTEYEMFNFQGLSTRTFKNIALSRWLYLARPSGIIPNYEPFKPWYGNTHHILLNFLHTLPLELVLALLHLAVKNLIIL